MLETPECQEVLDYSGMPGSMSYPGTQVSVAYSGATPRRVVSRTSITLQPVVDAISSEVDADSVNSNCSVGTKLCTWKRCDSKE